MDKKYFSYSGWKGHVKSIDLKTLFAKDPTKIIWFAVRGMLPKNKLRDQRMKMLKMFTGEMEKRYLYAVGRRNRSTVNVRLYQGGTGNFTVTKTNGSTIGLKEYFGGNEYLYENSIYPLITMGKEAVGTYNADIEISGGGIKGQSDAIRAMLKPYGLLKRDPRRKERVKPGLRGARRRPQWSKR